MTKGAQTPPGRLLQLFPAAFSVANANAASLQRLARRAAKGSIATSGPHVRHVEGCVFDLRNKRQAASYFRLMEARSRGRQAELERREKSPFFIVAGGRVFRMHSKKDRRLYAQWRAKRARNLRRV